MANELANIDEDIKNIVTQGIDTEELKEKIKEYIEVCKLKDKIAKEILDLKTKQSKTGVYVDDLTATLKRIQVELDAK